MGLICERMSEYKELIDNLRNNQNNIFQLEAADAIEQLVKERDAAVADIQPVCGCCKWFRDYGDVAGCFCPKPCRNISGVNTMWEWRGVQEEENGTEI